MGLQRAGWSSVVREKEAFQRLSGAYKFKMAIAGEILQPATLLPPI